MQNLQDLQVNKKSVVILRLDLDLPRDGSGKFTDLFRLESALPTLEYLIDRKAKIYIIAHSGRPKGLHSPALSLESLADIIAAKTSVPVNFITDPLSAKSFHAAKKSQLNLIENIRFWPEEEANSAELAQQIALNTGANLFVQEAFGNSHRTHASNMQFPKIMPSAAGFCLQKELTALQEDPSTPTSHLLVGGAKVESKLPVLKSFIQRGTTVLTGGVVANTLLKANGSNIGSSLLDQAQLAEAKEIIASSHNRSAKPKLNLPIDYLCAKDPSAIISFQYTPQNIQPGEMILDIGPETTSSYIKYLESATRVVWAGTLGYAENPTFAVGSKSILAQLLKLKIQSLKTKTPLQIIIGGGDTVNFVLSNTSAKDLKLIDHISTGGGASLALLSGKELPAVTALDSQHQPLKSQSLKAKLGLSKKARTGAQNTNSPNQEPPILIANLKANFNQAEFKNWLAKLQAASKNAKLNLKIGVAAADIHLDDLAAVIKSKSLNLEALAQDIAPFTEGAHTGSISAQMLKGTCSGSLIGHSEARAQLHQSNSEVAEKVLLTTEAKLKAIICIGSKSKQSPIHKRDLHLQLASAIKLLKTDQQKSLVTVAYEPVFAIGSGDVPEDDFLKEQLASIKNILTSFNLKDSKVLYGGSVSTANAKQILSLGFNGLLVGSASLDPKQLSLIGKNISA
jgi:3-phosphoglycerate kinase/triosephosphate isomerase